MSLQNDAIDLYTAASIPLDPSKQVVGEAGAVKLSLYQAKLASGDGVTYNVTCTLTRVK